MKLNASSLNLNNNMATDFASTGDRRCVACGHRRLQSGGLYVGCSTDFETRFREHETATACRTTKLDSPSSVAWIELQPDLPTARRREVQIKKRSRAKKEALLSGNSESLHRLATSRN